MNVNVNIYVFHVFVLLHFDVIVYFFLHVLHGLPSLFCWFIRIWHFLDHLHHFIWFRRIIALSSEILCLVRYIGKIVCVNSITISYTKSKCPYHPVVKSCFYTTFIFARNIWWQISYERIRFHGWNGTRIDKSWWCDMSVLMGMGAIMKKMGLGED